MEAPVDNEGAEHLSEFAAKALQEYYIERAEKEAQLMNSDHVHHAYIEENWELSQFWYDEKTADVLTRVAIEAAGDNYGRIACVSSPTVFRWLCKIKTDTTGCFLFEYDVRFQKLFSEHFVYYDYNSPLSISEDLKFSFDVVVVDPPYLSRECLQKVSETVKFLTKGKIILCTGAVMEEEASELLGLHMCSFRPTHANNLGNEFRCFANFDFDKLMSNKINI